MTHASAKHRHLDAALAEAMARDRDRDRQLFALTQDRERLAGDRAADARYLEALASSGGRFRDVTDIGHALLPSRLRCKDLRSMNTQSNRRVLLTTLSCRTSGKGTEYLSGFLAKARLVAFKGEPDKFGNETWNLYLSEPDPRDGTAASGQEAAR